MEQKNLNSQNIKFRGGFSLVELSVVLVIIAVIIGGILAGQSMIKTARLQSILSDWQKYSTAANSYFSKYNYWPGDDADAGTKWGASATAGNGDGQLGASNSDSEFMYFWNDLALAGFITGSYSNSYSATGTPKTQIPQSWMTHWYDGSTNQQFYVTGISPAGVHVGYSGETSTYVLSAIDALSLDTKIDDGLPNQQTNNTGIVIAVGATNNGASTTKCINGTGAATDTYQSTSTAVCNVYYIYKK